MNIWEAVQGVGFMVLLGLITRGAARRVSSEPTAAAEKTEIPTPRTAAEVQETAET